MRLAFSLTHHAAGLQNNDISYVVWRLPLLEKNARASELSIHSRRSMLMAAFTSPRSEQSTH